MTNNKEREARYAELIGRLYLQTSGGGVHTIEDIARAVMAVADAEVAELRALLELRRDASRRWSRRAEAAEAELAALRGRIEALADEVRTAPAETWGVPLHVPSNAEAAYMAGADAAITFATRRLAALAASPAEDTTPAEPCPYCLPDMGYSCSVHLRPAPVADPSGDTEGGQA